MRKNITTIISAAALGMSLLLSGPASAGQKDTPQVTIGPSSTYAGGSLVGARYSGDSVQYIGCTAYMSWSGPWTSCYAKDKAGKYFLCNSSDPKWHEVLQAMTDSSYLYITANAQYGTCTYISVDNSSTHLK
jgi:hypothetical protein